METSITKKNDRKISSPESLSKENTSGVSSKKRIPQFWYEDNNMRRAGGYPPDFYEMFTEPEKWEKLRALIDVYYIRGPSLKNIIHDYGEDFVKDHFAKVLRDADIPVAIDNIGRNLDLMDYVSKLRSYGLRVSHVALQSILSKVKPDMLEERIQLAIKNIIEIKKRFPDIKAGFICALPTKGREYKEPYRRVADGVKKAGYTLDFIHLDCPYNAPQSGKRIDWKKVKEVEKYVKREIGAEFGFISTSAIGKKSEEAFYTHVMDIFNRYIKGETLPDAFILMSWYPYPSRALPEDAPEGEYPMTKVGLHFAKHLKEWAQSE